VHCHSQVRVPTSVEKQARTPQPHHRPHHPNALLDNAFKVDCGWLSLDGCDFSTHTMYGTDDLALGAAMMVGYRTR